MKRCVSELVEVGRSHFFDVDAHLGSRGADDDPPAAAANVPDHADDVDARQSSGERHDYTDG